MKIPFREIDFAFEMANSGGYGESEAWVDKATGQIYYASDNCDDDEIPDDVWDSGHLVQIPYRRDFDLGIRLVFRFVCEAFPAGYDEVRDIFNRKGAYGRYKGWLAHHGLLDRWYEYENAATETALRKWCAANGIELEG